MSWIFNDEPVDEKWVEKYFGFVYIIENLVTGRYYVGRKIFWFSKKRKNGRRYKVESDWKTYYGSCDELLEDVKNLGPENFRRNIVHPCETRRDLTYAEAWWQFRLSVLEDRDCYNTNILGKFFLKDKTKQTPFHENICRHNMEWCRIKSERMTGEKHPNFGKSFPEISERMRGENNPAKRPEVREKISLAKKGVVSLHMLRGRKVVTPSGLFPTVKAAATHYGVSQTTMVNWLKRKEGFNYADE